MEVLGKVVDFCMRHQIILGCSTVSLLTAASEEIFSSAAFKCPCNSGNMLYGASFLLAPAFILFLLSFMVNPRTWRLLTGKCSAEKHRGYYACFCQVLLPMTAKALVAPLTWIAVALLRADYYECAASGSSMMEYYYCKGNGTDCRNQLFKMPCDEELSAKISSDWLSPHAQSQLIGWLLIVSILTLALSLTCIGRCFARVSYLQLRFCEIYSKKEEEIFEIKAKEHAEKLAKVNTNYFFDATEPSPFPTPSNEDWQKISTMYTTNSQEPYYSMIHKFMSTKLKEEHQPLTGLTSPDEAQTNV